MSADTQYPPEVVEPPGRSLAESMFAHLAGVTSRIKSLRFDRAEAGGALGDLGTFIPLLVGMVNRCGLQFGPAVFCAGLMNLVTGVLFGIPMPVQPMKAIAAVAIAEGLNQSQIIAAGIVTSVVILLLALSGMINWLNRSIPKSVVRGLQLAIGLKLLTKGFAMIIGTRVLVGWDSIGMGIICTLLVLMLFSSTRIPGALVIFGVGLVALFAAHPTLLFHTELGMSWAMPDLLDKNNWITGLWRGAIPQIPLTTLNSVIAVCALSLHYFPGNSATPKKVATSVALMNLLCCPFGAMPMCHGAGGLAAQYRFGARTGGSVVMLGLVKMALAVLFGGALLIWLQQYPDSVLGVLLLFGGVELALVCRDQRLRIDLLVMVLTAAICLVYNTAVGFVVGALVAGTLTWCATRIGTSPQDTAA